MKYNPLDKSVYVENRKKFIEKLPSKSLAIFNSNDVMPTNADGTMSFRQNNDLLYFSGIDQEESILLLFPDFANQELREILFVTETNEHIAIWEGHKYSKGEAMAASGVKNVMWLDQFPVVFNTLMAEAEQVFVNTNEHIRAVKDVETRDDRFIKWCKEKYPAHQYRKAAPIAHELRAIKSQAEIDQLQVANTITENAFKRVLKFVKPGVMEYEIEAEYLHE
ncbi:MAG: Xaa-Pro aminopeptidase, partial [Marivirga sp.]